jgi:hypothetical protein
MTRTSKHIDSSTARLALCLIDLRAHFEAQLRTVTRAEQSLLKCRNASGAAAFDTAADTLRVEVQTVADNRRGAGELVEQIVADARALKFV